MTVPAPQPVPLQLHQAEKRLVLAAPLPGLEPQDITVTIHGDQVIIDGAYRGSRQGQPETLVSEWTMGPYYREIRLPQPVNGPLATATYGNGVLVLAMPLLEPGDEGSPVEIQLATLADAPGPRVGQTDAALPPPMTQAQRALPALQAALESPPSADVRLPRRSHWEAVLQRAEGYDEAASAEADPSHANATAVFADGSRLWWNAALNAWEADPTAEQGHRA